MQFAQYLLFYFEQLVHCEHSLIDKTTTSTLVHSGPHDQN